MRLIDADELKEILDKDEYERVRNEYQSGYNDGLIHAEVVADDLPTIDAAPVIRCKDCKWYYRGGATCMFWDGANGMCGDDFCGKAERKEEWTG